MNNDLNKNLDIDDEDEKIQWKNTLIESIEKDPLYRYVKDFEDEIISDDIMRLNPNKRYTTSEVAAILQNYSYLYNPTNGKYYVDDNRMRWWLSESREDNLLAYLQIERTGKNWTWDVFGILRAKIVSILRYVNGFTQKQIQIYATGILYEPSKITTENVVSLIVSGNAQGISNSELRDLIINYALVTEKRINEYEDKLAEMEQIKESITLIAENVQQSQVLVSKELELTQQEVQENLNVLQSDIQQSKDLMERKLEATQLEVQNDLTSLKTNIEAAENHMNHQLRSIDDEMNQRIRKREKFRLEAMIEWDRRGKVKNFFSTNEQKETYIQKYVEEKMKEFKYDLSEVNKEQ
ncbi:hypothetical protein [Brevibacillus laterosporus]|uniref:Uncharacterized protein n=1 Tax=Brevibacillus laterosporus TaxID=1465 RepID=A0AAP8U682_BRELA|nr:hypothetical protein [Brevibacillus laterosporus]PPB08827.1 hypothetical protein C4A77_05945 [Brevibacillus laterosporus]